MKLQCILLRGLPASGKTSWCKDLMIKEPGKWKRVNKDDLRAMLDFGIWSKINEQHILKVRNLHILSALENGYSVLVDDTNLHSKHFQEISVLVKGKAQVRVQDFTHITVEECIERDKHRQHYVGEHVIRKMYRDFLQTKPVPPVYDPELPDAVICDLDGTLCLITGRGPYQTDLCEQDLVNEPVARILAFEKAHIILVSGRAEKYRPHTMRWLAENSIQFDMLYMRPDGDTRKDAVVKRELYEQHIQGKYNCLYIMDDRKQMTAMWREDLGLTVFQVAEGDY